MGKENKFQKIWADICLLPMFKVYFFNVLYFDLLHPILNIHRLKWKLWKTYNIHLQRRVLLLSINIEIKYGKIDQNNAKFD
jgi:hypothetical protein